MKFALLSVSDKTRIEFFAGALIKNGFSILSTGNTFKALRQAGLAAIEVADFTGQSELFGGRVKTLHPKIFGGILFKRTDAEDLVSARNAGIPPIDLVCVNLYPFEAVAQSGQDLAQIVENIDIGGSSLIRAAAKNYKNCLVVTSPDDYETVALAIEQGADTLEFRRALMVKAFERSASYDAFIANYFNGAFGSGDFGEKFFVSGELVRTLRYGENPHQKGALYEFDGFYSRNFIALKGEPSLNNLTDASAAVRLASAFENSVCIVKHANPCGFARAGDLVRAWQGALVCDSLSAYGGVVAVNGAVGAELARQVAQIFVEVLIAPSFSDEALEILSAKKRLKIFRLSSGAGAGVDGGVGESASESQGAGADSPGAGDHAGKSVDNQEHLPKDSARFDFKRVYGGFVLQDLDRVQESEVANAVCVTENRAGARRADLGADLSADLGLDLGADIRATSSADLKADTSADIALAWHIAAQTKSNCVVFVRAGVLLAIGMGLTSRVDAISCALKKAAGFGIDLRGAVMASEAFFPFKDAVEAVAGLGLAAIIQPGGSIRDAEVIAAANEHGIAMYFTGVRHFLH